MPTTPTTVARRRLLAGLAAAPAVALVPAALALPAVATATPVPAVGDDSAIIAAFHRWLDAQNEYERLNQAGADDDELTAADDVVIFEMFEALDTPANGAIGLAIQVYLTIHIGHGRGPDQHAAAIGVLQGEEQAFEVLATRALFDSVCNIFPGLRDLADTNWDEVAKLDLARRVAA